MQLWISQIQLWIFIIQLFAFGFPYLHKISSNLNATKLDTEIVFARNKETPLIQIPVWKQFSKTWWRHQMETFSALLAICAGNSSVPGEFPTQRPVTQSFDVFFDLRLNKHLSKQSWGWWLETLPCPLWRHRNESVCVLAAMHFPVMTSRGGASEDKNGVIIISVPVFSDTEMVRRWKIIIAWNFVTSIVISSVSCFGIYELLDNLKNLKMKCCHFGEIFNSGG